MQRSYLKEKVPKIVILQFQQFNKFKLIIYRILIVKFVTFISIRGTNLQKPNRNLKSMNFRALKKSGMLVNQTRKHLCKCLFVYRLPILKQIRKWWIR